MTSRIKPQKFSLEKTEERLWVLGVERRYIPELHIETQNYLKRAALGEPHSATPLLKEIEGFQKEFAHFLTVLNRLPDDLSIRLFSSEQCLISDGSYHHPEVLADWKSQLMILDRRCTILLNELPPPEQYSHKKTWSRDWVIRVKFVLTAQQAISNYGNWDFSILQWKKDGPYYRLAKVIKLLNETIPIEYRIPRPHDIVRELLDHIKTVKSDDYTV